MTDDIPHIGPPVDAEDPDELRIVGIETRDGVAGFLVNIDVPDGPLIMWSPLNPALAYHRET